MEVTEDNTSGVWTAVAWMTIGDAAADYVDDDIVVGWMTLGMMCFFFFGELTLGVILEFQHYVCGRDDTFAAAQDFCGW